MAAITIQSVTNLLPDQRATAIEVIGEGAKGGTHDWVVFFRRQGDVQGGYQHRPAGGYHAEHLIPLEVKHAAEAEYRKAWGGSD